MRCQAGITVDKQALVFPGPGFELVIAGVQFLKHLVTEV